MNPTIAEAVPNLTNAETAGVEIDLHAGAELEADHKVMSSARVKNVRTVEPMETNCARADEEPAEGFDSTLATVVGTDSIAAVAAHVHGGQADAVGQVSNKRKARQNAMRYKQRIARRCKLQEIGDGVLQTEEGAKDQGDRTSSKFVHDLNPLCPDSESEAMNPITSASDDVLVQEGASHPVSTGDETERIDTAAASEIIGVETEADLNSVAILSTNTMVSTAPVEYVCATTTETNPSAEAELDGDPAFGEEAGAAKVF
jgi:hypothetical protein